MKIAITTDSAINPYASTLLCALAHEGYTPVCVLSVERSKAAKLGRELRRSGFVSTLKKAAEGRLSAEHDCSDPFRYLEEYAAEKNLDTFNEPLPALCRELGIEYLMTESINSQPAVRSISEREIDVIVNCGGGIFRKAIVNAPNIGILNAHMGFLPTFRGMNVLEWSLLHKHKPGVTLHFIDTGIDTGDILLFKEIEVSSTDTIESLRAKALPVSVEAVMEGIAGLANGSLKPVSQHIQDGKQYFVMHERLKKVAEGRIARLAESLPTRPQ